MSRTVRVLTHGGPEVITLEHTADAAPGVGQVRVAVRAAALNPFDSKVRTGAAEMPLPRALGSEFAGVVDALGHGVTGVAVGEEVIGWVASGAQADHVVVKATSITPKPDDLAWSLAGGIGLVSNTALRSLSPLGLGPDDTLLITGVSGAVGLVAAQLALRSGCRVIGTARAEHHPFLEGLGVTPVQYGSHERSALNAAAGTAFTAALDTVGPTGLDTIEGLGIPMAKVNSIAGGALAETLGASTVGGGGKTAEELAWFAAEFASGRLILPVRATFSLDQVRDAYIELETGHRLGKVVLLLR